MKRAYNILIGLALVAMAGSSCSCSKNNAEEKDDRPSVKASISERTVSGRAGSFEIYITSNTSWTVTSQVDWMSATPESGNGNRAVTIEYEAADEERRGNIRITAEGVPPVSISVVQTNQAFKNPISPWTMPDPYIVKDGSYYYTCKAMGNAVGVSRSNKLTEIQSTTTKVFTMPGNTSTSVWNIKDVWAPELFHIDGKWYIYYAAGRGEDGYGTQRTGVLRSRTDDPINGGWEDMGMIFTGDEEDFKKVTVGDNSTNNVDNTIYAIDMTTFELKGKRYAVWSGNRSREDGSKQDIYIATMSNPYTIDCPRVEISRADQPWENITTSNAINEGPAILVNEEAGKLFCVYSCNGSWTTNYRLGYLMLDMETGDPMNPDDWTKSTTDVFYRYDGNESGDGVNGVGHCSFTKSPDGTEDWIIYHTIRSTGGGWSDRWAFAQKVDWNEDGTPDFGEPVGWGEPVIMPSGETL